MDSAVPQVLAQTGLGPMRYGRKARIVRASQGAAHGFEPDRARVVVARPRPLGECSGFKPSSTPNLAMVECHDFEPSGKPSGKPSGGGGPVPRLVRGRRQPKQFQTHAARRFSKAEAQAEELLNELPLEVLAAVTGSAGGCQLPLDESRVLVRCALLAKGGPEGGATRKALRA